MLYLPQRDIQLTQNFSKFHRFRGAWTSKFHGISLKPQNFVLFLSCKPSNQEEEQNFSGDRIVDKYLPECSDFLLKIYILKSGLPRQYGI